MLVVPVNPPPLVLFVVLLVILSISMAMSMQCPITLTGKMPPLLKLVIDPSTPIIVPNRGSIPKDRVLVDPVKDEDPVKCPLAVFSVFAAKAKVLFF